MKSSRSLRRFSLQDWQLVTTVHGQLRPGNLLFKKKKKLFEDFSEMANLVLHTFSTPTAVCSPVSRNHFSSILHISREFPKMLRSESCCISIQLNLREEKFCNERKTTHSRESWVFNALLCISSSFLFQMFSYRFRWFYPASSVFSPTHH